MNKQNLILSGSEVEFSMIKVHNLDVMTRDYKYPLRMSLEVH